jgi:TonB family protein
MTGNRNRGRAARAALCALSLLLGARAALAADDGGVDGGADGGAAETLTAPVLRRRPLAPFPAEALAARLEGDVGLELAVDATGKVTEVKVVSPAGHGFDEAAATVARAFVFEPARRDGVPIESRVQLTYEFRLPLPRPPPPPPPPPKAPPLPAAARLAPAQPEPPPEQTVVMGTRPISAASSFSVRDRDFQLRPIGNVQDILRVTPGLVMVQHSGGGKANQYFMRGFDADHGTDLALSIDGVPINMPSHAHGQGFSDTNFIIPEVVERVEITKGPYFVSQGDFATAGAVNMVSRDSFEHSSFGAGLVGSPGHGEAGYRALGIASPHFENPSTKATFAAEVGRTNGPFDNPEGWDKYKLFSKVTLGLGADASLSVGEMSYAGNWHGSGQIPARAVDQGLVSRFGSLDPDEGGNTARHQIFAVYRARPMDDSELRVLAYLGTYRFNLFSNFTLYLRDPVNGDEIEQVDRRTFYGGRMSYRVLHRAGPVELETTIGADARSDDIHEELWDTAHRQQLMAVRANDVHESFVGAYFNEQVAPARWLRANVGGRADLLSFAVDDRLVSSIPGGGGSGVGAAHQLSPKASLILTPLDSPRAALDVYLDYGHGFHSNDVRGVFADPPVTPLARAIGEEVGARARLFGRWDLAAALWQLDLASEIVWNGDDGTTVASDPTTRRGVEVETRLEVTPWLAADLDLTFTKSRFSTDMANGGGLALAPKQTWAGGLSARHDLGGGVGRAGLRFYGIGDRPATDDGALVAPGFTQFDLHLGYRRRRFDVALDVENLLNGTFRSAQFATVSRLPNEPAVGAAVPAGFGCGRNARLAPAPDGSPAAGRFFGCEDIDYTPAYPLTLRLMATLFLD